MRRASILVLVLAGIALGGCSTIDLAFSSRVEVPKKLNKIAVFSFDVKGAGWGDEFADAITHQFFKSGRVDIVEREAIEKIIKEQNLSATGLIEESSAVRIGKMVGADVILIGRGSALRLLDGKGKDVCNLIDTFTLKAISIEKGDLLFTVRKEPGAAWNWKYRAKFCCSGSLIWSHRDILEESSCYDDVSKQVVRMFLDAMDRIEQQNAAASAKSAKG